MGNFDYALSILNILNNRRYDCGKMKRSVILQLVRAAVDEILDSVPALKGNPSVVYSSSGSVPDSPLRVESPTEWDRESRPLPHWTTEPLLFKDEKESSLRRIDWNSRKDIRAPEKHESVLVINAGKFPPEGGECDSRLMVEAFQMGWKRFIVYKLKGQRFTGCGFGPETEDVRVDVYGSSGDYLASGVDGMELHIHDSAQDQLCQVMKRGKLVVYGDVGQAFMYGAKGGDAYIMGNAAGRPLINAVGKPRVVINGTCLDFLAESFMAGNPLNGGGFVVLNGIQFDDKGEVIELESPYPGTNIFSLASGGAIYLRDPHKKLVDDQLNGGEFAELADEDWELILPYLKTNEEYFGISVENDLLTVNGIPKSPKEIFRKVQPRH